MKNEVAAPRSPKMTHLSRANHRSPFRANGNDAPTPLSGFAATARTAHSANEPSTTNHQTGVPHPRRSGWVFKHPPGTRARIHPRFLRLEEVLPPRYSSASRHAAPKTRPVRANFRPKLTPLDKLRALKHTKSRQRGHVWTCN